MEARNSMLDGLLIPLETYVPPGVHDFDFRAKGLLGIDWLNKPMIQAIVAFLIIAIFFLSISRKLQVVPSKVQWAAEEIYNLVRNSISRELIGPEFKKFTPYLLALFTFILLSNWFGQLFLFMFPTFSMIGYVYGFALVSFIMYVTVGFKTHGFRYLKYSLVPPGTPAYLLPLMVPLEFLSNFITRPVTLAVRLFANMLAGHLSVLVFAVGGGFLITYADNLFLNLTGVLALVFSLAMACLELVVGFLQAYVFTVLNAQYISSSLSEGH